MTWSEVQLGELVEVKGGKRLPKGAPYAMKATRHAYVRVCDIENGQVRREGLQYLDEQTQKKISQYTISRDDVFISIAGSIGLIAIIPDDLDGANLTENAAKLVIKDKRRLDRDYLAKYLASKGQADIQKRAMSTSQPKLALYRIEEVPIPLPPLPEQRRIADILDKADAIRRKRKEAIALTEELLQSAFLNIVGPGARDYAKWPSLKMEQLALDEPGSMRTGPFGSDLRHSEFVDEGVAVLGIDNAVENRFAWDQRRFITEEKYADLRRYTVKANDVIVTIMGTTGRSAVVPQDIPRAITTKHLATITLDRAKAEPEFVSQSLHRHPEILKQIAQSNRGAIMNGLNLGLIRALELRVPPIDTQRHFSRLTAQIRQAGVRTESANEDCDNLFATLAHKAFTGSL